MADITSTTVTTSFGKFTTAEVIAALVEKYADRITMPDFGEGEADSVTLTAYTAQTNEETGEETTGRVWLSVADAAEETTRFDIVLIDSE